MLRGTVEHGGWFPAQSPADGRKNYLTPFSLIGPGEFEGVEGSPRWITEAAWFSCPLDGLREPGRAEGAPRTDESTASLIESAA